MKHTITQNINYSNNLKMVSFVSIRIQILTRIVSLQESKCELMIICIRQQALNVSFDIKIH